MRCLWTQVYSDTKDKPHIVHAVRSPKLKESKYTVELQPLGYRSRPANEVELRNAMRAVLGALAALHGGGFVHRDVRWDNVLRDSQVRRVISAALSGSAAWHCSC